MLELEKNKLGKDLNVIEDKIKAEEDDKNEEEDTDEANQDRTEKLSNLNEQDSKIKVKLIEISTQLTENDQVIGDLENKEENLCLEELYQSMGINEKFEV